MSCVPGLGDAEGGRVGSHSFLMDHIHLSHDCYKVLDDTFGWVESEEELRVHFPEGFVNYLTDRVTEEDAFRYDKTPVREDFDYEAFLRPFWYGEPWGRKTGTRRKSPSRNLMPWIWSTRISPS